MFETISIAIAAFEKIASLINSLRERARQNAELTPEQEKELDDRIALITSQPWWKPED